jgi:2-polyprenyl-3-methyl-5-hydroxy-6-metoxy-1,4-benzoquinol methylase
MSQLLPYEDPALSRAERINLCVEEIGFDYEGEAKNFMERCNLCGESHWTIITHRDRYGLPATTTSCCNCGLTVINPRLSTETYGRFYDGVYRPLLSAFYGRHIDAITIQDEQREYSVAMARLLEPYLKNKNGASLLDVGGSTGIVSAYLMQQFGLRTTLIDPAPAEIDEAKALGIETVTAFVEEWNPEGRKFDVVAMFQTIDHLLDVGATLRKLRNVIADGGLFVVDIVDFRAAYLRNWSVEMATKIDHPYSLTQETTEAYLARCGFEVLRKNYAADHLHITYVCRPGAAQENAAPSADSVRDFFREVRTVHNAPSGSNRL